MKWEKKTLNECCISIADGDHQAPPKADKGVPFITISNINADNKIDFSSCMFVTKEYYENLADKRKACKNDVLYSVVGSFGIPVFIDKDKEFVFQRHIAILRPDEKRIYPRFLYYSMKSRDFYNQADSVALGAAQRTISLTALKRMNIFVPPLETQNRIASILSAYDDLIENNQKQIKLLEEAAQRLYKEWFVDLRFPGHEDVKIVDGVPEGWKKGHINELIAYDIGGGWGEESSSSECQVPAFVIRGTDFDSLAKGDMENIPFRYHKESNYCKRKLEEGDIVFEVSGGSKNEGVARTMFVTKSLLNGLKNSVICASFCKLVRPKKGFSKYLYDSFRYMRSCHITEQYDKRSASSIVNFRWQEFLVQEMVLIPSHNVLNQYNDLSLNINKIIERKVKTCNLAKEARDRLLPKLMSGEIEV